jgi:glutamyl-tRNA reductase
VLARALALRGGLSDSELQGVAYAHAGEAAVRHVFRVAAGLDSMVVGEPEIARQVRHAAALAAEADAAGPALSALFREALSAGRRVRRATAVGRGAVSTASVTVALARRALGDLRGRRVLIVGAGAMSESAARALERHGVADIAIAARTLASSNRLASKLGGRGVALADVAPALAASDLVVACTDAPGAVLSRQAVAAAVRSRPDRRLVCIDLAVPRDVEAAAGRLDGVVLLDLDDVRALARESLAGRALEARRGEAIVTAEVERFLARLPARALAAA